MKVRCAWAKDEPLFIEYHDQEWGVPIHDDQRLFESLVLGGAQAGLSWATILRKRKAYRDVFDGFDPVQVAHYGQRKINELLKHPGIVRNRLKIESAVTNTRGLVEVQQEYGDFDSFIWRFVNGTLIVNRWTSCKRIPTKTRQSDLMSQDLQKRGFTFVGPTICYAFMQAVGMVNDHTVDCFRHRELSMRQRRPPVYGKYTVEECSQK